MRRRMELATALLLLVAGAANRLEASGGMAPAADRERIVAAARGGARAGTFARHLAGEIGPRLTGTKNLAIAERWARDEFERMGLENVRLEKWGVYQAGKGFAKRPGPRALAVHNVVGEIRGSAKSDELVLVGAHLDSWDFAQGATDNAAGCAAILEAARSLRASGVRPARTIRFILFTGEEQGLLGAKAYVESHPEVLAKTSAFLNMDAGTNPISGLVATEAMRPDLSEALAVLSRLDASRSFTLTTVASFALPSDCCSDGATHSRETGSSCRPAGDSGASERAGARPPEPSCTKASKASCATAPRADAPPGPSCSEAPGLGKAPCGSSACARQAPNAGAGGCASDHTVFLRAGVPAFIFEQEGRADYARTHHTEFDTLDALDLEAIQHSALVVALAAFGIADLPERLSRANLLSADGPDAPPRCGGPSSNGAPALLSY